MKVDDLLGNVIVVVITIIIILVVVNVVVINVNVIVVVLAGSTLLNETNFTGISLDEEIPFP